MTVAPRKSLGQHFLHDQGVLSRIAALAAPEPESGLVEVGPGPGALTEHLLDHGVPLLAIERDDRLPEVLAERFAEPSESGRFRLLHGDATRVDWAEILADPQLGPRPVVVGNLPYNVGAAILMRILEQGQSAARVVVMLQREVAERICAAPGSKSYGLLAVHSQWRAEPRMAMRVGPGAFRPPPKVDSAVVVLKPRPAPPYEIPDQTAFDRVVGAGFAQRRKTLVRALQNGIRADRELVQTTLESLGLPADARAERLDLAAWAALTRALAPSLGRAGAR